MRKLSSDRSFVHFIGLAAAALLVAACSAGPMTSRTGSVHDIIVKEEPEPAEVTVNPGDEVRWVNRRAESIQIELVGFDPNALSCNRGFANFLGGGREFTMLEANETASACFPIGGVVNYNIRMESAVSAEKKIVSGVIRIGN